MRTTILVLLFASMSIVDEPIVRAQEKEAEDDAKTVEILDNLPPRLLSPPGVEFGGGATGNGGRIEWVQVAGILSGEVSRYITNRLFEQKHGYRLVPEYLDLKPDQVEKLARRFNLFVEANRLLRNELWERQEAARQRGDMEVVADLQAKSVEAERDMDLYVRDFNHDIAEVLKPDQVSRLRAMAITTGLEHFGGWDQLLEKSMTYHGVDPELITRLKRDREFQQKLLELRQRHYLRLIELNQQTMDEFLELLPEEPRAAVERTLNIDTLTRTRPTGQDK